MGQCSSSQHPEAEQQKQQQAAACVDIQKRQEQLRKKAAAHMNQPYQASSNDELVLLVSLDSITKIG
ncbi:uncharacterized protein LOC100278099 [Zea mays]|uniref:Uncharacterized protein n=1 Tax=Zea mays TaxID=4577 RepID=B6U3V9_MAIZE|nr:uncharacterized protein LOC100278099 [Zea mays]ACG44042.1 hypothetical protein [Zea mays]AQK78662.1 hypothetical protein ZEAMMB73_Zm00001d035310 [Zea mays]